MEEYGIYCAFENAGVCRYASCVSINKFTYTPLINMLGKYCAVFKILGIKFLMQCTHI